ncbi:pleckstrin homology domain-containing family G member 1 isoform X2 [Sturnira hondurensis]|nr:pleckstrin homology domain-containing family G member 1 isoform X2 [Sturnira hondurensis]XP_036905063.1 pleckstrin homology domain-containing family G member 1 isoform X2 [Sturnira hondurensis]XP_036905148.1 pleckstrin homology domain-containing family G member 1 isoform X2 [Sturnira hondurensis]XP_036905204.1 pleckstrin homology domain-containing family G member 1 isoform X2 [Sturnira hondurensis]XP_036905252.1 pleckstrin homology domain-containing family G member 1 isoform X2 [Sturnira hon
MELSDSDRPVSFGSTSSSASSRDSHGSFGSRVTLVSNSHLGLFPQDKEAGAIKLELIPARPFSSSELQRESLAGQPSTDAGSERQPRTQRRVEANGAPETSAESANSPKLLYVDRVVQEILETERTYVQDLKSIVEDYLDCIRDQTKLPLGTEERSALFGNIQDIYHFNSELLQDLENCENDPVAIAECFVSKSEEFHIYTQYCTNYPRSVAVLTECMRNKTLAKFFRERQETLKHSLPLGSYLLKPVQRILKYHLLLHEIENHLDKDTEGYDVVLDAIDTMQRVAWHINDMKRKHEHAVRLQEIQSLLTNWKGPDLTSYGELVLEGTFRLQRAKNERTLFLFDKLLLITKKRDDTFTYKAHILCGNLMLVEVIPKEPLSFSVFHYKNPKLQHTVQAKSQQDKRLWILHLKRLILENHAAKIPAKAKQAILEMDAIHYPGFCYSPEGQAKALSTPYRPRRKSEPSSRSHKVLKTSGTAQDIQKVSREQRSPQRTSAGPSPAQRSGQPSGSAILSVLRGGGAIRDIWTDHQIRQALFPSRRSPQEHEDDEDDYQMFVPSFSSSDLNSTRLCEDSTSSRPCSWHMGQVESTETTNSGHRVVRRASSAGESNTCPPEIRIRDSNGSPYSPRRELQNGPKTEGQDRTTPFGSSIELTLDDIDHVYDNISYEDLKVMVAKREEAESTPPKSTRDSVRPKSTPELAFSKSQAGHGKSSANTNRDRPLAGQEAADQSTHELEVGEENIYDTIRLPEPPSLGFKCSSLQRPKRSTFLGLDADFACCDSLRPFVSQDSLQFSEDETPSQQGPSDNDYLSLLYSSFSCNLPLADKSISDRLSEEVDEIWNDLENYIKKNEVKARDRLLAAFPVSKDDVQDRPHAESTPELSQDSGRALSTLSLPERQALLTPLQDRPSRASRASCPLEEDLISKEGSFLSLNQLPLASEVPPMENPYDLANSSLSQTDLDNPDPGVDATDKTKSRVFMMARQYSQKIKKANQLLKVKSPELEQPPASQQHKSVHKDLAAILEDKKQGGPAIGARIAEYSQLYDQIVFRESPFKTQKDGWASPQESSNLRTTSPSQVQRGSEDWLLHSTYSNGELADFCPQPERDLKPKYPTLEINTKSTPRHLSTACSVPSLQTPDRLLGPLQRHSVVVSQPNKETSCPGHLYNSLGRRGISAKSQPYNRSQSSSSILINKSVDSINYPNEMGSKQLPSLHKGSRCESHQRLLPGVGDSRPQEPGKRSDLTLQDSQKVLVVNRNLPLNAQVATQNYFSNFKETEGDEDDYVEIKSEEDESELELSHSRRKKSEPKAVDADFPDDVSRKDSSYSLNSPSTPKKPVSGKLGVSPYLTPYNESDKLNDYLWRSPSPSQQNIVQSLREKFQCLSSSSFA